MAAHLCLADGSHGAGGWALGGVRRRRQGCGRRSACGWATGGSTRAVTGCAGSLAATGAAEQQAVRRRCHFSGIHRFLAVHRARRRRKQGRAGCLRCARMEQGRHWRVGKEIHRRDLALCWQAVMVRALALPRSAAARERATSRRKRFQNFFF